MQNIYQFAGMDESVLTVQAKNENTIQVEMQKEETKSPDPTTKTGSNVIEMK